MRTRLAAWLIAGVVTACDGNASDRSAASSAEVAAPSEGEDPETPESTGEGETAAPADPYVNEDGSLAFDLPEREVPPAPAAPDPASAGTCPAAATKGVGIMVSPRAAAVGRPVQVLVASFVGEDSLAVRIEDPNGTPLVAEAVHRVGSPASVKLQFEPTMPGPHVVVVGRGGEGMRCKKVGVRGHPPAQRAPTELELETTWPIRRHWGPAEEALFSAWVRELFWAPSGEDLAFSALSELTSDPRRNVLHGYFGWGEDGKREGLELIPDCADTPYFLRAYFAWKRGLGFGFRRCSRGRSKAPVCFDLRTNESPPELSEKWESGEVPYDGLDVISRFFKRTLAWGVHTGNGRCAHGDSSSDLYAVRLDARALRPGMVYADPYGHILTLVEHVPQRGSEPGILYAVDGQPDGSITRKRFWEGNFLWNQDPALGGSGFKAFRPVVMAKQDDTGERVLVQADDQALARLPGYDDFSVEQGELSAPEFYDRMESLISPRTLDPFLAQEAAVQALAEAARVRVTSVQNGVDYVAKHPDEVVLMPRGHEVFETSGAWENYSTPARDLRLLIAIDVVVGFEDKFLRRAEAFGIPAEGPAREELLGKLRAHRSWLLGRPEYALTWTGSDGAQHQLDLATLVERAPALELAYNPNDCPEVRWGEPAESPLMGACKRRASARQQAMMREYRGWFGDRRRPARGDPGPHVPELDDLEGEEPVE